MILNCGHTIMNCPICGKDVGVKENHDIVYFKKNPSDFHQLNILREYLIGNNGIIAGGCFKHLLSGNEVKDIDIFFRSEEDYAVAKKHFVDEKLFNDKSKDRYKFAYENNKVYAFIDTTNNYRIELIRSFYGEPEDILNNFDFTVTKIAMYKEEIEDSDDDWISISSDVESDYELKLLVHKDFFEHLFMKRIVIDNKINHPISTFDRVLRYSKKYGFGMCKESKKKLIERIKEVEVSGDKISESLYEGVD